MAWRSFSRSVLRTVPVPHAILEVATDLNTYGICGESPFSIKALMEPATLLSALAYLHSTRLYLRQFNDRGLMFQWTERYKR